MTETTAPPEFATPEREGQIYFSYALSGPERGAALRGADVARLLREDTLAWVHLDANDPATRPWIRENLPYLDSHAVDALLAEETRPRATRIGDGVLVILRGANHNEGEEPEDMVSIRMWIDAHRIISLRRRSLRAVEDVAERVRSGRGPDTAGEFLALLIERVNQRMEPVMRQLDEEADDLEEEVIVAAEPALRRPVTEIRRRAIAFRRYIAPQREAVLEICDCELPFVDEMDMRRLSEAHDHLTRNIEDLDAIRERAQVVKDELHAALSDRLNQNLYFLAIISAVFLPLSFLTGLLGINVGGIPGSENGLAFWYVTGGLTFLGAVMLLVLRRLRWI